VTWVWALRAENDQGGGGVSQWGGTERSFGILAARVRDYVKIETK